jgi:fatty-acyl-CoA synthase
MPEHLDRAAAARGSRTAIAFFGHNIPYAQLRHQALALAGWLQRAGVSPGDRVLLYMQNSPQWAISYYGVLYAGGVAVPVNPMNRAAELARYIADSRAEVAICAQELAEFAIAASGATRGGLREIMIAAYSDYLPERPEFDLPEWITAPAQRVSGCTPWREAVGSALSPRPAAARPGDLAVLNYTSGSSGEPKGCRHTHQSLLHSTAGLSLWHGHTPETVFLGAAPMYQIAGLVNSLNCAIYCGGTLVPMPRWDRALAVRLIERYHVTFAGIAPAAIADLLNAPDFDARALSSLTRVSSGGSTMPKPLWNRIREALGLEFIEVYGMTESGTIAINPIERPKPQCLGVPFFDTDVRVIDPETLAPLATGEPGEIVVRGPQLFRGYWRSEADAAAFVEIGGNRYFRTGDIGCFDKEGYLFMTDRLKRMINAAGYKVWPAEVEAALHEHPDIAEVCVIGARDARRGETVKALVVLRPQSAGRVRESDIIDWARARMAAFKYPRMVEFVEALPKSPAGKVLWKELQEKQTRSEGAL